MATAAVELTIPAPHAAKFTNGEKGVGCAAAPVGDYRFSRRFQSERGGVYLLKLWCKEAATLLIGANAAGLTAQLSAPANGVIVTQVYLPAGDQRIDIHSTNTAGGSDMGFAMSIFHLDRLIYASDNDGWVYSVGTTVVDVEVPAPVENAPTVFPFLPNWADGITERVSYLTDIPTSETGTEQRRSVRRHPRREFDVNFMRRGANRARLDVFLAGIGRRVFQMPMWHEQVRVTLSGTTCAVDDLHLREFRVGDQVLVSNGDPTVYEILRVSSIDYTNGVVQWVTAPLMPWPVGTRIIPLRRARIVEQSQVTSPTDSIGKTTIRFKLVDPDYRFGASWGTADPVWTFPINRATEINFSYDRIDYSVDNEVGPVDFYDPSDNVFIGMRFAVLLRGRSMCVALRRFIDVAEGRAGRFYMPTKMSELNPLTETISGVTFDVTAVGYTDYMSRVISPRSIICITLRDGSPNVYGKIIGVERIGVDIERVTLTDALPSITVRDIRCIQFMVPSRFDQDTFELKHHVDDSAAVSTSIITRSVDPTDMPSMG